MRRADERRAIARAHQTLSVGAADVETARHLRLPLNAPTVEARCVVTDRRGVAIYVGEIIYRGDVVHLDIELIGTAAALDAPPGAHSAGAFGATAGRRRFPTGPSR